MKAIIFRALFSTLLLSSCSEGMSPVSAPVRTLESPPQATDNQAFDCSEVKKISSLPYKPDEPGADPLYYEVVTGDEQHISCLLSLLDDSSEIPFPGPGPKLSSFNVSALAYILLVDSEKITFGDCIPKDVMSKVDKIGAIAYVDWLSIAKNGKIVKGCVASMIGSQK